MDKIKSNKKLQLVLGLLTGIIFGFLLHKGGVTKYDVIIGQLRLIDHTVLKIMLSAVIVTTIGISILYPRKLVVLDVKSGSIRNATIGGLIFGIGFGILGYCPGTIAGAVGNGYLDALLGGLGGIVIGSGIYASVYGKLRSNCIIRDDRFSGVSLYDKMKRHPLLYTVPLVLILALMLYAIEKLGG